MLHRASWNKWRRIAGGIFLPGRGKAEFCRTVDNVQNVVLMDCHHAPPSHAATRPRTLQRDHVSIFGGDQWALIKPSKCLYRELQSQAAARSGMLGLLGPGEGGNTGQNTVNVWWTVGIFSLVILLLENLTSRLCMLCLVLYMLPSATEVLAGQCRVRAG